MMKYTLIATVILLCACKKEDKQEFRQATLSCYSMNPKFVFKYKDKDGWHEDTIRTSNHSVSITVAASDLEYIQQMHSVDALPVDSMSITGTIDGRSITEGFRSISGPFSVGIQLSQAK